MGAPSPSRRRVPQACDRCRVKKGKCDGKKPVCTRCALDGQMCMFSERKFSKDRVIPKGYVELLENRVEILETGLREALLQLNTHGGIRLPHSPSSTPPSPTSANYLDHATDLNYNITQALKELQAMKSEREKGSLFPENDHDHDHDSEHSDHGDSPISRHDSAESTASCSASSSSAKTDELVTPVTSLADSPPPQKTLFLETEITSAPLQVSYMDNSLNFYPPVNAVGVQNMTFNYDDLNLTWLDTIALDETYDITLQGQSDFPLVNL